jgi:hypothetical protein
MNKHAYARIVASVVVMVIALSLIGIVQLITPWGRSVTVMVTFTPEATEEQKLDVIRSVDGRVVATIEELNVWTIEIPGTAKSKIDRLKTRKEVRAVARVGVGHIE